MIHLSLLAAPLSSAPWSLICLIISIIFLILASFVQVGAAADGTARWRFTIHFGWAGVLFAVLAMALK